MPKVLVVDDSPAVLEATRLRLQAAGFEVVLQDRGLGTLPLVLKEQPDLILLDITMPTLNGTQLCRMLKSEQCMTHARSIPVLLHSSLTEAELNKLNLEYGANGFLQKGWPWERKLEVIRQCLA